MMASRVNGMPAAAHGAANNIIEQHRCLMNLDERSDTYTANNLQLGWALYTGLLQVKSCRLAALAIDLEQHWYKPHKAWQNQLKHHKMATTAM